MRIKTLDELTAYDERVAPISRLDPAMGALTEGPGPPPLVPIQAMIADCDLVATVPEHVRAQFEVCRTLHTYGSFAYEFFTVAEQRAYAVFEAALGARFLAHYPVGIPLEDENGVLERLHPTFYGEVVEALRPRGSHPHRRGGSGRGWILQGHPHFNGSLRSLLRWAWATGLLSGQRNRVVESALHRLRNLAAHPHSPSLVMPSHSAGAIRDVAEIINHLWGRATAGGRLYGAPRAMTLVCLHRVEDGNQLVVSSLPQLRALDDADRRSRGMWVVLEVAHADEAFAWSPDYETTAYPTTVVATSETWDAAVAAWEAYEVAGFSPRPQEWCGRLFLVRYGPAGIEPPRSPAQFRALAPEHRDQVGSAWWMVRADHPGDVPLVWRDQATVPALFADVEREELFPVRGELEGGTWQEAAARLTDLGQ